MRIIYKDYNIDATIHGFCVWSGEREYSSNIWFKTFEELIHFFVKRKFAMKREEMTIQEYYDEYTKIKKEIQL